VALLFKK